MLALIVVESIKGELKHFHQERGRYKVQIDFVGYTLQNTSQMLWASQNLGIATYWDFFLFTLWCSQIIFLIISICNLPQTENSALQQYLKSVNCFRNSWIQTAVYRMLAIRIIWDLGHQSQFQRFTQFISELIFRWCFIWGNYIWIVVLWWI